MSFLDNRDYKGVSFRLLCQELTPFSGYDPGKQEVSENRVREDAKRSRINHGKEKISKNRGREDVKRSRINHGKGKISKNRGREEKREIRLSTERQEVAE